MQTITFLIIIVIGSFMLYEVVRVAWHIREAKLLGKKAVPVSKENPKAKKHILIMGDSTAFGTGASDQRKSLIGRLAKDHPEAAITNLSQNALNIDGLLKKIIEVSDKRFDIIMIHIGGIDTLSFTPFRKVCDNLKKVFEIANKMTTDAVILISMNNVGSAPAFRFPLNVMFSARSRKLRDRFADICAEYKVVHIPLFMESVDDPLPQDPTRLYARDNIHPNNEGYSIWYKKIKDGIANYL